jgi:pimeloyl-ACP methyl ester carboxylesterase
MNRTRTLILIAILVALTATSCSNNPVVVSPTPDEAPPFAMVEEVEQPQGESAPTPEPSPVSPFSGEGPWTVAFDTADGITLAGTLFGTGPNTVVLSHMYLDDQSDWHPFARTLEAQGFRVLTFNFRGYGNSGGERDIASAPTDLEAALTFLRSHEDGPTVLIGAGVGGMASIHVAAQDTAISGLAVISAPQQFEGLEVVDSDLSALALPSLWLGTRNDLTHQVETLYEMVPAGNKEIWIYEGSSLHGTFILGGADGSDMERRLLEFTSRVLGT